MFALHNNNAYLRLFTVQEYCRNHFGGIERLQIDINIRALGSTLLEVFGAYWLARKLNKESTIKSNIF
ncbi:hypothetical protein N9N03_00330 [Chlamydiia bacterium]|nr:hypothetical protein [Chlamydiia bacterium]